MVFGETVTFMKSIDQHVRPAFLLRCALTAATVAIIGLQGSFCPALQATPDSQHKASPGDSPDNPGPLARLSGSLHPKDVKKAMRKVADWQLAKVQSEYSQDWTYAALYIGMLQASDALNEPKYGGYVQRVAEHYAWALGPRRTHADDQAIGQSYLWLYNKNPQAPEIDPLRQQFDDVMQAPDNPEKPVWWWCDALFMAPPVWAQLASITQQPKYLDYMDREWHITSDLLWDNENHLFFRDASYLDKREKNGKKIFWSRGNGWVMGGLVRTLTFMPQQDKRRAFYIEKFRAMAEEVRSLQGEDGLWRPGLLDAGSYPYPEVSGSAFFVYSTAWGIQQGILDRAAYLPVVQRGWKGLVAHIYEDGRLGSIQPIGAAPGAYTPSSSYVFGTGAFLLAGSEVLDLDKKR